MTDSLVEVRLIGIPVSLVVRAREHWDALIRELAIIAMDPTVQERTKVPHRLSEIAQRLGRDNAALITRDLEAVDEAIANGAESVDLNYEVPRVAGEVCRKLDALLEEADEYCREEKLLTQPATPNVRAYRRWLYAEFIAQCAGADPTPWPNARSRFGAPS